MGNVQGQNFSSWAGMRDFAFDPKGSRAFPHPRHESITARSVRKSRSKPTEQPLFVQISYVGMNQERQPSLPVAVFLLD